MDFNESDVIKHCGSGRKSGQHVYFQCPICAAQGEDKNKNNLIYTPSKGLLLCFKDASHSRKLLSTIFTEKHEQERSERTVIGENTKQWQLNKKEYIEAMAMCHIDLMECPATLEYLEKTRLINKRTVDNCFIGYDFSDDGKHDKWVFPVFLLKDTEGICYGFEYRPADFKPVKGCKCWKEKDTPSGLAVVWGGNQKGNDLYIVEGFLDGYILAQWMGYPDKTTIVTPTMGVSTLPSIITEIEFNNFDNIYLCLDNDDAGRSVTAELIADYPFLENRATTGDIKDITEAYREELNENG